MNFVAKLLAGTAAVALVGAAAPAYANIAISGTAAGTLMTDPGQEIYHFGDAGGNPDGWGSPGVSFGTTTYNESSTAFGLVVNFHGGSGTITPGSIAIGDSHGCGGGALGGTVFCDLSGGSDIWEGFATAHGADFLAQSSSFDLPDGGTYFVNVVFTGGAPTSFTGEWLTTFTPTPTGVTGGTSAAVPEPASMTLLGAGLAGLGLLRRRKRKLIA